MESAGILLGLLWGALGLCQPALTTLPLFLCVGLGRRHGGWRHLARVVGLAGCAAILVMIPWWLRNFYWFGRFVPFTTAGGLIFLGPLDVSAIVGPGGLPQPEAVQAEWTMRYALAAIAQHPSSYAAHALFHAARAILLDVGPAEQFFWFNPVRRPDLLVALMVACQASWAGLRAFVAAGMRRAPGLVLPLLAGVAMQFATINIWLQFHERHRLILMPLLILLAIAARRGTGPIGPTLETR